MVRARYSNHQSPPKSYMLFKPSQSGVRLLDVS
jgi:hypothetical protein